MHFFQPQAERWHLKKFEAWTSFYNRFYKAGHFGKDAPRQCDPRLATAAAEIVKVRNLEIGILPLNTAWFAQADDDSGKLFVGEPLLRAALNKMRRNHGMPELPPWQPRPPAKVGAIMALTLVGTPLLSIADPDADDHLYGSDDEDVTLCLPMNEPRPIFSTAQAVRRSQTKSISESIFLTEHLQQFTCIECAQPCRHELGMDGVPRRVWCTGCGNVDYRKEQMPSAWMRPEVWRSRTAQPSRAFGSTVSLEPPPAPSHEEVEAWNFMSMSVLYFKASRLYSQIVASKHIGINADDCFTDRCLE